MDTNLVSFFELENEAVEVDIPYPDYEISDTLKISGCRAFAVRVLGNLVGGKEDCVDINNKSSNIHVTVDGIIIPMGKYVATIKGGSSHVYLSGVIMGHGSEVDIDIGNISDQSDNLTGPVYLNLLHVKGKQEKITVRCIGGPRPVLMNEGEQDYEIILKVPGFWQSVLLKAWKFGKKIKVLP
jgi:hypothetical protein